MTHKESFGDLIETDDGQSVGEISQRMHLEGIAARNNINRDDLHRLNEKAFRVVERSEEEARQLNRAEIDGGVLVLGLFHESAILQSLGCHSVVQEQIREMYEQSGRYGCALTTSAGVILEKVNDNTPFHPRPVDVLFGIHALDGEHESKHEETSHALLQGLLPFDDPEFITYEISKLRRTKEAPATPVVGSVALSADGISVVNENKASIPT